MKAEKRRRVLASRRVASLSVAVLLRDETTADRRPQGELFVRLMGAEQHAASYALYPLVGVPGKRVEVTVGGKLYQEETVRLDLSGIDRQHPFKELALKRRPASGAQDPPQALVDPDPVSDTVLKGRVLDLSNGAALTGARIGIRKMTEKAVTGKGGAYCMTFPGIAADQKVTLCVSKDGYKVKEATILLKKEAITVVADLKLAAK